jgi:hypothetical protein
MLANGCCSPKYLLLRKPNIWPRKHSSCCFSESSCSLSIDVDNIIVSSQFLLEVIFSPSSSILKWCSVNADSSSRPLLFFIRRATERPSFSSPFLHSSHRPATILFFIRRAAERPSFSSFIAQPSDHPFLHSGDNLLLLLSRRRAAGRPSISFCLALPGANQFLHLLRCRAPIYYIFILHAAGRQSILFSLHPPRGNHPYPHSPAPPGTLPNLICFILPTGDYQESSCRRAIIKNHPADRRLSTIFVPTGNYPKSSR